MEVTFPSQKIYLAKSHIPHAGRGVFATEDLQEGEVIEHCPVIAFPKNDYSLLKQTLMRNYYFLWGEQMDTVAVACGFGSLYNHSYEPNATYIKHIELGLINFITLKAIKKDEEITVNYNHGDPYDKSPLWMTDVPGPKGKNQEL